LLSIPRFECHVVFAEETDLATAVGQMTSKAVARSVSSANTTWHSKRGRERFDLLPPSFSQLNETQQQSRHARDDAQSTRLVGKPARLMIACAAQRAGFAL